MSVPIQLLHFCFGSCHSPLAPHFDCCLKHHLSENQFYYLCWCVPCLCNLSSHISIQFPVFDSMYLSTSMQTLTDHLFGVNTSVSGELVAVGVVSVDSVVLLEILKSGWSSTTSVMVYLVVGGSSIGLGILFRSFSFSTMFLTCLMAVSSIAKSLFATSLSTHGIWAPGISWGVSTGVTTSPSSLMSVPFWSRNVRSRG